MPTKPISETLELSWLRRKLSNGPAFQFQIQKEAESIGLEFAEILKAAITLGVIMKEPSASSVQHSNWQLNGGDTSPLIQWQLPTKTFWGWLDEGVPSNEVLCVSANPLKEAKFLAGKLVTSDVETIALCNKLIADGAFITRDQSEFLSHVLPLTDRAKTETVTDLERKEIIRPKRIAADGSEMVRPELDGAPSWLGQGAGADNDALELEEKIRQASEKNREIEAKRTTEASGVVRIQ